MTTRRSTFVFVLAVAGCLGDIDGDAPAGPAPGPEPAEPVPVGGPGAPEPGAPPAVQACQPGRPPAPGRSPLRRLTRFEYNNTVRDLLGDRSRPADRFPGEETGNGFGNDADALGVSRLLVDQYFMAAEALASRATSDPAVFARLLACDVAKMGEDGCARAFIETFGSRAFRRPLEPAEAQDLYGTYTRGRAGADFVAGIQAVIQVTLQAPQFLYRFEAGTPLPGNPGVAKLTPWEVAARLSYLLTGSMPDGELSAAAKAGKLGTREEVLAQARRLAATPGAREVVRFFHEALYEVDAVEGVTKNAGTFPAWVAGTGALLREETERFLDHVVWDGPGDLGTLLTASFTFLNARLAKFYGVAGVSGDAFRRVELDPQRRAGVATHAAILAATSPGTRTNPVGRGKWVRKRLLCDPPPSPPADLMVMEPPPVSGLTTRERFVRHAVDPACSGCHSLMDPIGFGLETYDAIGLWRTQDAGKPIDARGEIVGTAAAGPFDGPVDLMRRIAASPDAGACYVRKWLTFAQGRSEVDEDLCARRALEGAFAASGGRVRDLLVALTQTDAFLYRRMP